MPPRAVLFDLGNTLVSYYTVDEFPAVLRRCLAACMEELGVASATDTDEELFGRVLALNPEAPDHVVRPLAERLAVLFPGCKGKHNLLDRLQRAFLGPIFATAICDPQAIEVLSRLRACGIRTAIVSNTPWGSPAAEWRRELARHGLLAAVDVTVFCVEVGYRKPHPKPIRTALEALDIDPSEALFVGDEARWDIAGAQAAGVRPALLTHSDITAPSDHVLILKQLRDVFRWVGPPGQHA